MDLSKVNGKSAGKESPFWVPLATHGKRSKHEQELEEVDSDPHGDSEGFTTPVGVVTADTVETAENQNWAAA